MDEKEQVAKVSETSTAPTVSAGEAKDRGVSMNISEPIHAGELRKIQPTATMGEICHTVWDLIEANEIEIDDESHMILPKQYEFHDTNDIDALIAEMEAYLVD